MLKFKYNYLENTLAYQTEPNQETWLELGENQQFTGNFGSSGFKLDSGLISFNLYEKQIKAFYKQTESPFLPFGSSSFLTTKTTYYRKYLAKDCPVIFEFSEKDEVEKVGSKWIYKWKGGQNV